jgi:hypothetical protein
VSSHHIENYKFGEITISGKKYHKDVIILPEHIIDNWRRDRGHYLQIIDLDAVLQEQPQVLVIGQGAYSRMLVPNEIHKELEELGIQVFSLPTGEACEKFNQINPEKIKAAALHLTC